MKRKNNEVDSSLDPQSILNTNRTHVVAEEVTEEDLRDKAAARKQKIVSWCIVAGVVVALVLVFVVGGIVSHYQYQKKQEQEAEEARIAALKEPREDTVYFGGTEPELASYQINYNVVNAYYTKENGMCVVVSFANGHDVAVPVTEVSVTLRRDGELVASGRVRNIVDVTIPATGDVDYTFYLDPSLVKITDVKEDENVEWEVMADCDVPEEAQEKALEPRTDGTFWTATEPAVAADQLTHAVLKAYYTNEGGIQLTVAVVNGKDVAVDVQAMQIRLYQTVTGQEERLLVATHELSQVALIPAGGKATSSVYLSPEEVTNSALTRSDTLTWEIEYQTE